MRATVAVLKRRWMCDGTCRSLQAGSQSSDEATEAQSGSVASIWTRIFFPDSVVGEREKYLTSSVDEPHAITPSCLQLRHSIIDDPEVVLRAALSLVAFRLRLWNTSRRCRSTWRGIPHLTRFDVNLPTFMIMGSVFLIKQVQSSSVFSSDRRLFRHIRSYVFQSVLAVSIPPHLRPLYNPNWEPHGLGDALFHDVDKMIFGECVPEARRR